MSSKTTNYNLHKIDLADAPPDITVLNQNWDTIDAELKDLESNKANSDTVTNHVNNKSNPHGVTKTQVGLGNVPNVTTNDQTPTYSQASELANLTSGEKLSVTMGKIMKLIADFISHKNNKSNPHGVTASQLGVLSLAGGVLTGALTVIDNFNINKTYDNVEYKTYIRPVNYELGGEYTTGLIHYNNGVNNSQLLFNKNGVAFRDNVNAKLYQLFGQHNGSTAAASVRSYLYTYGTNDMTPGTSALDTGKIYFVYE